LTLAALGGEHTYLGSDPARAAGFDVALLVECGSGALSGGGFCVAV